MITCQNSASSLAIPEPEAKDSHIEVLALRLGLGLWFILVGSSIVSSPTLVIC